MKIQLRFVLVALVLVVLVCSWAVAVLLRNGLSARDEPTRLEAFVARRLRHLAVPRAARDAANPVLRTTEALARARAHFADHCASCHGNDGRGRTALGQNLYPKAPDMTLPDTQQLSDGEIFYVIENGIRLTGMPAWGPAKSHDGTESWELVHFIRHLPQISAQELGEMDQLNPRSRKELAEEEEERRFLAGEDVQTEGR
jgi:mono/diheme cytochrome c family protein